MKHIVVIDDSDFKRETITGYMREIFPDAEIHEFGCVNHALLFTAHQNDANIQQNPSDWLIITDMIMPRYTGGMPEQKAGVSVLRELNRRRFACPAILQSSDTLNFEEFKDCYKYLLGTVKESPVVYNLGKYKELLRDYIQEET